MKRGFDLLPLDDVHDDDVHVCMTDAHNNNTPSSIINQQQQRI